MEIEETTKRCKKRLKEVEEAIERGGEGSERHVRSK
jgi:hypothetical protein